ncbi:Rrf2 family transcriptional regulator [Anaerococcus sp. AGMB00486]|uniref:Rrf2 family transcriptional regulator n=2 Tax=Anaerococcus TaxID=165779 RepID=A0ABX2N9K4_9FIRM|nr:MULTISPECIES: Rrf2 family transcriptional regulator [Anaerococcus]MDY3006797.1 Rrf2 family transcriptional regulator [Anaerococcus porci]MSS78513.1 Rrf2 family transcriptional regulator [Anaerococcus porci]NVF11370.1 Rrf2 family transcriptional regulator [Anaerococcus faecalis]
MDVKFSSAIHTLILISEAEIPISSEHIANSVGTNASYIRKLTSRLSKAGIIEGHRGVRGFTLNKRPSDITMLDIYRAVMQTNATHFFDIHQNPNDECIVGHNIKPVLSGIFQEMEENLERQLSGFTLDECINIMRKNTNKNNKKLKKIK